MLAAKLLLTGLTAKGEEVELIAWRVLTVLADQRGVCRAFHVELVRV